MMIAIVAAIAVVIGCWVYVHNKSAHLEVDGPCYAPTNGDIGVDIVCKHLKLFNDDLPASLED